MAKVIAGYDWNSSHLLAPSDFLPAVTLRATRATNYKALSLRAEKRTLNHRTLAMSNMIPTCVPENSNFKEFSNIIEE